MPKKDCPVCGAKMLTYENPPRRMCPRAAKHDLYINGNRATGRGGRKKKKA